jgi:hypothetical protein
MLALLTGCGADELNSPTAQRLRGLAVICLDYAAARGSGPKDQETLVKHMGAVHESVLTLNNIDPKDPRLFISDRDQEPFVFRWGQGISYGTPNPPLLAHEKTGKNGQRLVVYADGELGLVDDARFKELTEGKQGNP